jgi:23S rRNA pseudouridine2605 synthase
MPPFRKRLKQDMRWNMSENTPKQPPQSSSVPGDRIAKVLSRAGIASRREAERMIEAGRVRVNGTQIDSPALNVTARDEISVDGVLVGDPEPPRMWLYHKPTGVVTTNRDEKGRGTIFDDLPDDMPRVMSIGRLDLNSEGLLLLTNDGEVKRKLELPSNGWLRRYRVRVNGRPSEDTVEPLRKGITVDGEQFQPMTVTIDRQHGANAWLTVGLREGKNREIRRAMEAVHLSVNRLIRTSYGPFQLGELKSGEVEEIKRKVVRDQLGIELADNSGTAVKKKPSQLKRTPRKPGAPGPGRPGLPKAPTEKLATANSASGKPKPGYGKSKPSRPAHDATAPRKFGVRVKSTRKP